jgi:ankyrin repeat protein
MSLTKGFPRFTDIFAHAFAVQLGSNALVMIVLSARGVSSDPTGYLILGFVQLLYAIFIGMVTAGLVKTPWKGESRTIHLAMAIYMWLCGVGVFYLTNLFLSLDEQWPRKPHSPVDNWFLAVVILVPTSVMLCFRETVHKKLGEVWLKRRLRTSQEGGANSEGGCQPDWGAITEVQKAITASCSPHLSSHAGAELLNSFVYDGSDDSYTLLMAAAANGHNDAVQRLLTYRDESSDFAFPTEIMPLDDQRPPVVDLDKGSRYKGLTPLFLAAQYGRKECVSLLLVHGCEVDKRSYDGTYKRSTHCSYTIFIHSIHALHPYTTPTLHSYTILYTIFYTTGRHPLFIASACDQPEIVQLLIDHGATDTKGMLGMTATDAARILLRNTVLSTLRAYESAFEGNILDVSGAACVVSWPGVYAKSWDVLVLKAQAHSMSAAVVFMPENTLNYGAHGSDRCYCHDMYGEIKPWGCKWFELWREHVEKAAALNQRLQVFYYDGHVGSGKVPGGWEACAADATKRGSFVSGRNAFLDSLPEGTRHTLSEVR